MYDFNKEINRHRTASVKWDSIKEQYGRDDLLPMWIADMDLTCPDPVLKAVQKRAENPVYGYTLPSDECYQAIINKFQSENGWHIKKEWIIFTNGVVDGIDSALRGITNSGDSVVLQPPVYYPFFSVIHHNKCNIIDNPLIVKDGQYKIDYIDLEQKLKNGVKALLFCSPHNPVGRVWSTEELDKISSLCEKYHCILLSDEIHCDVVYKPNHHTVMASLNEKIEKNSISFFSTSKSYNTAGLSTAFAVIPDEGLRQKFLDARMGQNGGNLFGFTAIAAAYQYGTEYKRELLDYIKGNIDYFIKSVHQNLPLITVYEPQGTYLVWIDMKNYHLTEAELEEKFIKDCQMVLDKGSIFGKEGNGFFRFNLACPRHYVEQALEKMYKGFRNIPAALK